MTQNEGLFKMIMSDKKMNTKDPKTEICRQFFVKIVNKKTELMLYKSICICGPPNSSLISLFLGYKPIVKTCIGWWRHFSNWNFEHFLTFTEIKMTCLESWYQTGHRTFLIQKFQFENVTLSKVRDWPDLSLLSICLWLDCRIASIFTILGVKVTINHVLQVEKYYFGDISWPDLDDGPSLVWQ